MKTATSKIKQVVNKKEFTNKYGTTIYHDLLMENGDKIQIGKKKEQLVGWELSYRIENEGAGESGEYKKASAIKPEEVEGYTQVPGTNSTWNTGNVFKNSNDNDQRQRMIIAQSSLSSAVELYKAHTVDADEVMACAKKFYDWVIKTAS